MLLNCDKRLSGLLISAFVLVFLFRLGLGVIVFASFEVLSWKDSNDLYAVRILARKREEVHMVTLVIVGIQYI